MQAQVLDIYIEQGATYSDSVVITQPEYGIKITANGAISKYDKTIAFSGDGTDLKAGYYLGLAEGEAKYKIESVDGQVITLADYIDETAVTGTKLWIQSPCNLTGFTARAQVRRSALDPEVLGEFDCTIVPFEGRIDYSMDEPTTRSLPTTGKKYSDLASYQWSLELVIGYIVTRLYNGAAKVSPEATK